MGEQMRDFYLDHFKDLAKSDAAVGEAFAKLDWQRLWYEPGMPDYVPTCDETPLKEARALAESWAEAGSDQEKLAKFSAKDVEGWGTTKLIVLLDALLEDTEDGGGKLSEAGCKCMAESYGFLKANCELRFRFLRLALGAKWSGAKDAAVD